MVGASCTNYKLMLSIIKGIICNDHVLHEADTILQLDYNNY